MPNRVVKGAVVKANEFASREIRTYVRNDGGLLVDRTELLRGLRPSNSALHDAIVTAVEAAAADGKPFTRTGQAGLYMHRNRLSEVLQSVGRERLERLAQDLITEGRIVQCKASGSHIPKWLNVPDGPFALGIGEFREGAAT